MNQNDLFFMQRALDLANTARYRTSPNPRVGCVLVKAGIILGEGATQVAGKDHAEVSALKDAYARGYSTSMLTGATAYVTLEPCNHVGRTGACTQALIDAGIQTVFALMPDPNPLTAGQGIKRLRADGMTVWCGNETNLPVSQDIQALIQSANELNIGFFKRMHTGLPWLRLKVASSLDGYIALPNGHSQWLTGKRARQDTHHWRASSCAVVTGIGTILKDNPLLNVREVSTVRQPLRIVLDTHLRIPLSSQLITSCSKDAPVLIVYGKHQPNPQKQKALESMGVSLLAIDTVNTATQQQQLSIQAVYSALGALGLNEIHIEAGSALNQSWLHSHLLDEIILYQAPLLLGKGLNWSNIHTEYTDVSHIKRWHLHDTQQFDQDIRLRLRAQPPV
jgi:diaminohydroxyphosphoribosylaminopyrimidine deaminase / 5-amino-6-(5-phosphoribosylamino)uracil reductase